MASSESGLSWTASVEIVEDGFFHSAEECPDDRIDDNRWHHIGVIGLPASVQFFRARVSPTNEPPSEHLLIGTYYPRLPDETLKAVRSSIAATYPSASLSCVVEWSTGRSKLIHEGRQSPFAVAAAAAAWMCFGSWDESDPILVTVDGRTLAASMEHSANRWYARLSDVAA